MYCCVLSLFAYIEILKDMLLLQTELSCQP
jgi:hypothetical protein